MSVRYGHRRDSGSAGSVWSSALPHGEQPVLRGLLWRLDDRAGYAYGTGFKPRLERMTAGKLRGPLRVEIEHGSESIELVARDILGLTKVNYNACGLGRTACGDQVLGCCWRDPGYEPHGYPASTELMGRIGLLGSGIDIDQQSSPLVSRGTDSATTATLFSLPRH